MGIGSTIGQVAQSTQSAPQPMGGKGGGLGTNPYAQSPSQPPQPMGGKGGMPYQPLGGVGTMPPGYQPNFGGMNLPVSVNPYMSGGSPGNPGFQLNPPGQNQGNFLNSLQGLGFFGQQPPQPRFTDLAPDFMSPRGATTGGPRTLEMPQQPQFDDRTTQAEFDRARGITPAAQPTQPGQVAQPASGAEEAFRNATTNVRFASSTDMEAAKQDFMNQYNQRQALQQQYAMPGQDYRSVNPVQIEQMRQMQQPQFMGGKGGQGRPLAPRYNNYNDYMTDFMEQSRRNDMTPGAAQVSPIQPRPGPISPGQPQFMGGYGGGFNPYAGGYGGGLGGLAALMQGRGAMYNKGGEVK